MSDPIVQTKRTASIMGAARGLGAHTEKQGKTMLGAEAVIASLEAEGVDVLFGYPGGQAIRLYDALYHSTQLKHILARHEQGAVHMADGYLVQRGVPVSLSLPAAPVPPIR